MAVLRAEGKEPELVDDVTKTANRRVVTADAGTVTRRNAYQASFVDPGDWVFGRFEPANPDRIGWWWQRALALSGVEHSLAAPRSAALSATQAIGHGHDVRMVAGRLGHADASMTLRVYAHVLEEADQAVAATLPGHWTSPVRAPIQVADARLPSSDGCRRDRDASMWQSEGLNAV